MEDLSTSEEIHSAAYAAYFAAEAAAKETE